MKYFFKNNFIDSIGFFMHMTEHFNKPNEMFSGYFSCFGVGCINEVHLIVHYSLSNQKRYEAIMRRNVFLKKLLESRNNSIFLMEQLFESTKSFIFLMKRFNDVCEMFSECFAIFSNWFIKINRSMQFSCFF